MQLIISALGFFSALLGLVAAIITATHRYLVIPSPSSLLTRPLTTITVEVYVNMTYLETTFVPGAQTNSYQKKVNPEVCVPEDISFFATYRNKCLSVSSV